jgi:hypothetical protein
MSLSTPEELATRLEQSCTVAWSEEIGRSDSEVEALEMAATAVEDYLSEQRLPLDQYNTRDIAVAALRLTPAELQSLDKWCPGYGDEQNCDIDPSNPCAACRSAGAAQGKEHA